MLYHVTICYSKVGQVNTDTLTLTVQVIIFIVIDIFIGVLMLIFIAIAAHASNTPVQLVTFDGAVHIFIASGRQS